MWDLKFSHIWIYCLVFLTSIREKKWLSWDIQRTRQGAMFCSGFDIFNSNVVFSCVRKQGNVEELINVTFSAMEEYHSNNRPSAQTAVKSRVSYESKRCCSGLSISVHCWGWKNSQPCLLISCLYLRLSCVCARRKKPVTFWSNWMPLKWKSLFSIVEREEKSVYVVTIGSALLFAAQEPWHG